MPSFMPALRYGGPITSVLRLCQAMIRAGVDLDVATTNSDGPIDLAVPTDDWTDCEGVRVRYFPRSLKIDYAPSVELARWLFNHVRDYDLLHLTSTFSFPSTFAGIAARRARVPYVVSPRGSMRSWALAHRSWKKWPYWYAIEKRHLRGAAAIHATSEQEREEVGDVLPGARIFVVPNGVDGLRPPPIDRAPNQVVFLGRLHPIKGFDVLVPALSRLARNRPEVETIVAGPDDCGEWSRVEAMLAQATPRPRVRYVGPVAGAAKFALLAASTVLVLPSHSENFGQVVVEALSSGTPVVVSRNCPWAVVERRGAGFWVENTPAAVAAALERVLGAGPSWAAMSAAATALASEYCWSAVGASVAGHLERILADRRKLT